MRWGPGGQKKHVYIYICVINEPKWLVLAWVFFLGLQKMDMVQHVQCLDANGQIRTRPVFNVGSYIVAELAMRCQTG